MKYMFHFNSFMTEALSYRNQSIDLFCKSMDWFLYDNGLRHEVLMKSYDYFENVISNQSKEWSLFYFWNGEWQY